MKLCIRCMSKKESESSNVRRFVQKKYGNQHTFVLSDEDFTFQYDDRRGAGELELHYAELPSRHVQMVERNEWLMPVGCLSLASACAMLLLAFFVPSVWVHVLPWAVLGIGSLLWAYFSTVRYTVWRAEAGAIYLIHDKQYDVIFEDLISRRKLQLRKWYGDINFANDLDQEIEKFKWLGSQEVFTPEETEQKIAQIEKMKAHVGGDITGSERLN